MKRLILGAVFFMLCSPAFGQYLPYASQVFINQNGIKAAPYAQVTVCPTSSCVSHTALYGNSTGSGGQIANPVTADQNGRFSFWTAAGVYYLRTVFQGAVTQTMYISLGGSGGTSGVSSVGLTGDGVILNTTVANSPVTTAGTLGLTRANAAAYSLLANNTATSATPSYVSFASLFGSCSTALTFTSNAFGCNTGLGTGSVTSIDLLGTANQIEVVGTSPITTSGSWTLKFPDAGVTLPGTTTGTFSGNVTGDVTGNVTGNADTATSATSATSATTATALASVPAQCGGIQFATGIAANGDANCATPSGGSGTAPTIKTNTVDNTSQILLDFTNSSTDSVGLHLAFSNPSGGVEKAEITGGSYSGNAATATALAANPTDCGANTFANQIAANGDLTCTSVPVAALATSSTTVNGQTCTLGSTCGVPFSTNGSGNTSIAGINLINSTVDSVGLTATVSNPATNQVKVEITGGSYSGNAATATTVTGFTAPTPAGTARLVQLVASGTVAMNTGTVAPGACETTVTATATGAVNTDNVDVWFQSGGVNVDIMTVTGYNPLSATGSLTLGKPWVTAGQINIRACNSALNPSSITPGAVTAAWRVTR